MASSSMFLLSAATALRRPAANLMKNKFVHHLHPIRSSLISVTNTPPSSSFHSSTMNNINASPTVASHWVMMKIPYFVTDRQYSSVSVSRLPRRQEVPASKLLSDEDEGEIKTGGIRRVSWEDEEALYMKIDMPGAGKEDVKVSVENNNTLILEGEDQEPEVILVLLENHQAADDDKKGKTRKSTTAAVKRGYRGKCKLDVDHFKIDQVKVEMKNGVLMVCVPKVIKEKAAESRDIFHVKVN